MSKQIYDNQQLYDVISELGVVNAGALTQAFDEANKHKLPLDEVLLDRDIMSDKHLGTLIADLLNVPFTILEEKPVPSEIFQIIPETVARSQEIIAFKKDETRIHVGMTNPKSLEPQLLLAKKVDLQVKAYLITQRDFKKALTWYSLDLNRVLNSLISEQSLSQSKASGQEPPIIKIVQTLLTHAYHSRASDVHIEPQDEHSLVRFRIDGIMIDIITFPLYIHKQVITRIKVMAKLRIDEHHSAQDGKLVFKGEGSQTETQAAQDIDVRVSIVPITQGEKVVMRLLSEKARQYSLLDLGFSDRQYSILKKAYKKPHGMILATGPTGSGKTTTLYTILKQLNRREVNIMTIEDPVEYDIDSISQIQVNPKSNLTFSAGLRSIVRQDPDIILVGEIRDTETASIAVNAGMTGHLVLSTLHTNDAPTTIPRMLELDIEPYLLASTVHIIIAQRLVRQLCQKCRVSIEVPDPTSNTETHSQHLPAHLQHIADLLSQLPASSFDILSSDKKSIRMFKGKGCELCHNTGYKGRIGIFELLEVSPKIQKAITEKHNAASIRHIAIQQGMTTMLHDGLTKVLEGQTSLEEVIRVTRE